MNKRIRQLYYECQDESQSTEQCYQKFAEWIVMECVDYAFANGDNVHYLLQHFRVEE